MHSTNVVKLKHGKDSIACGVWTTSIGDKHTYLYTCCGWFMYHEDTENAPLVTCLACIVNAQGPWFQDAGKYAYRGYTAVEYLGFVSREGGGAGSPGKAGEGL